MKLQSQKIRPIVLASILLATFFLYGMRLMRMQVVEGEKYQALVEKGSQSTQVLKAARGEIVDRYGRPFTINRIGFDIEINRAFLPKERQNEIILKVINLLKKSGEPWIDNLPITKTQPFMFVEEQKNDISKLKKRINVGEYATVEDVMYQLKETYKITGFSDEDARLIAGVRYEMDVKGFNLSNPYTFANDISIQTVSKIEELNFELPGISIVETPYREYVSGNIGSNIIGRVGPLYKEEYDKVKDKGYSLDDIIGKDGIEKAMESELRGVDGEKTIMLNSSGEVTEVIEQKPPRPGNTVVLSIDKNLQKLAQDLLEKKIMWLRSTRKEYEGKEAEGGAVAIVQVKTGEVLALANYPTYDISTFSQQYSELLANPLKPLFNRAVSGTYTPGSIFKPCTAVAGLSEGLETETSTITCSHVYTFYDDYQPQCTGYHGNINVLHAIEESCNIYFYDLGRRLGINRLADYAHQMGLGVPTGIEIDEQIGQMSSPEAKLKIAKEAWQPGDTLQAAIGQSVSAFTPLQLANYAATIANKGKRMKLTLVKSINSYTLESTIKEHQPTVASQVKASEAVFDTVKKGMVMVSRTGSARSAFANYKLDVASKTGTPQSTKTILNGTFIAFAPANDPEIAVAIAVEKGGGGYMLADIARNIFDEYFFSSSNETAVQQQGVLLE